MVLGSRITVLYIFFNIYLIHAQDVFYFNKHAASKFKKGYNIFNDSTLYPIAYIRCNSKKKIISLLFSTFFDEYDIVVLPTKTTRTYLLNDVGSGGWLNSLNIKENLYIKFIDNKILVFNKSKSLNLEFIKLFSLNGEPITPYFYNLTHYP